MGVLSLDSAKPSPSGVQAARVAASEKRLRDSLITIERVLGRPVKDIAAKYAVSQVQVRNIVSRAERDGFLAAYEDLLVDAFLPKALAVYDAHLQMGSLEAARDLLFGLGVLKKAAKTTEPVQPGEMIESLEVYRLRRSSQAAPGATIPATPAPEPLPAPAGLLEPPSDPPDAPIQ